ncbi:MAG: two-component system response regulator [Deltaproteobacteria bacterium HGW-Deltaproteobacteria-18]|nr:MAG: two-component system response regulator [Deltaproteobacteria bacterium HGW-Deltaproteobacteria-18]
MMQPFPVLIVDDEADILTSFGLSLRACGIDNIICCQKPAEAMRIIDEQALGAMILDLSMPGMTGQEILSHVRETHPELPVIVATGVESIESAVECMKLGALDYLAKPVEAERLEASVRNALEMSRLRRENTSLRQCLVLDRLTRPEAFAHFTTASPKMRQIFQYLEAVSASPESILINGETGVGKELAAKAVHKLTCPGRPFVTVNVAGLDDMVFSDTLFGHRKGAFTGAVTVRKGLVEQAADGVLFLDEIGDLSETSQVKLLRLLQEREYMPLGADLPRPSEARVVVATNRDLEAMTREGRFRKDLYYRLCTHLVRIPPLRERTEDLPVLLELFIGQAAASFGKEAPRPSRCLVRRLSAYPFPGNVRELRAFVFDAMGRWNGGDFSCGPDNDTPGVLGMAEELCFPATLPSIEEAVQSLVREAMSRAGGVQTVAARWLGISQPALSKRLKKGGG